MLLINTSLKAQNNTEQVIQQVATYFYESGRAYQFAHLTPFPLFTGEYITEISQAADEAAPLLSTLATESDHLYFVPTYYKMMPGAFKNFLDITRIATLYHGKRIGIVATNAKNQDYGARQFLQTLLGLLEFHMAVSVFVPQILILDPEQIDIQALRQYVEYFESFPIPG
ncbi:MAG: NAD(P)H-dependent oxidoreductase [Chloroflexota bacterium]